MNKKEFLERYLIFKIGQLSGILATILAMFILK